MPGSATSFPSGRAQMIAASTPSPKPSSPKGRRQNEEDELQHADFMLKGYTCMQPGTKLLYQLTANLQNVKHFSFHDGPNPWFGGCFVNPACLEPLNINGL